MPKALVNPFGKRQPRALVVGLRRVVKDPRATVAQRLEACKLLARVEGYIECLPRDRSVEKDESARNEQILRTRAPISLENAKKLRELLSKEANEKVEKDLLAAPTPLPADQQ